MRLIFHDCMRYEDDAGHPCDGCINFKGVGVKGPDPNNKNDYYRFKPLDKSDNNNMDQIVAKLELIYTTIDWPFVNPSLNASLRQAGRSRADLWNLASMVALERTIERANRACDLDFHARQQNTLLESREACEIKLTKPLKFLTGRSDCRSDDPEGRGYVTTMHEIHNRMFAEANTIVDFGKSEFNLDAVRWVALMAIHGSVHFPANLGVKYTWVGPGYLSNVYYKMIANRPMYRMDRGGDMSFGDASGADTIYPTAIGDPEGRPTPIFGWRASCMAHWNTTEGGPCFLRPTKAAAPDGPNPHRQAFPNCLKEINSTGHCVFSDTYKSKCANAWCDENRVEHGAGLDRVKPLIETPWYPNATDEMARHTQAWSNQFAFPWEVGMFWNFSVGGEAQRPVGCPGLDRPFGKVNVEVEEPNWPYRVDSSPIFSSPAMNCSKNQYAPEGTPLHQVVDELAADNEYWAEMFLEGWHGMVTNQYTEGELRDGPESGWFGHYSLTEQGIAVGDFAEYIERNKPVYFTDPKADPFICAHRGHGMVSCGFKMSTGLAKGRFDKGPGDDVPAF